jgi:hypothetical protein
MKKLHHELSWGIYFTLMMIGWMALEKLLGFHDEKINLHAVFTNLVMLPAIALFILAIRKKRLQLGGKITYKLAFVCGAWMIFFITLLTPLTIYSSVVWISPDFFQNMIDYSVKNGLVSKEQAISFFNLKSYMIQSVLATPIMGLITTSIVSWFSSRK